MRAIGYSLPEHYCCVIAFLRYHRGQTSRHQRHTHALHKLIPWQLKLCKWCVCNCNIDSPTIKLVCVMSFAPMVSLKVNAKYSQKSQRWVCLGNVFWRISSFWNFLSGGHGHRGFEKNISSSCCLGGKIFVACAFNLCEDLLSISLSQQSPREGSQHCCCSWCCAISGCCQGCGNYLLEGGGPEHCQIRDLPSFQDSHKHLHWERKKKNTFWENIPSQNPFWEPFWESQNPSYCENQQQAPFSEPFWEPFPRAFPRTFSEPFLERCVAVRPLRRAP